MLSRGTLPNISRVFSWYIHETLDAFICALQRNVLKCTAVLTHAGFKEDRGKVKGGREGGKERERESERERERERERGGGSESFNWSVITHRPVQRHLPRQPAGHIPPVHTSPSHLVQRHHPHHHSVDKQKEETLINLISTSKMKVPVQYLSISYEGTVLCRSAKRDFSKKLLRSLLCNGLPFVNRRIFITTSPIYYSRICIVELIFWFPGYEIVSCTIN